MSDETFGLIKLLLSFGLVFGLLLYETLRHRRYMRRLEAEERAKAVAGSHAERH
jgi:hypothetical protein